MHYYWNTSIICSAYVSDVDKLFTSLFPSDKTCLNTAERKSASLSSKYPKDTQQKAIQLVNIYTQDCKRYATSSGTTGDPLYKVLNENLRSGSPTILWNTMAELLSKGLALLGPQNVPNLYRSCHCPSVAVGTPFTFSQFASTSTNPNEALKFLFPGKSFIHIKNGKGTDIEQFSNYPSEKELLLPPDVNLDVIQVETDVNRIRKEIQKIAPGTIVPAGKIAKYIVLDGSRKAKKPKGGLWSICVCGKPWNTHIYTYKHTVTSAYFITCSYF